MTFCHPELVTSPTRDCVLSEARGSALDATDHFTTVFRDFYLAEQVLLLQPFAQIAPRQEAVVERFHVHRYHLRRRQRPAHPDHIR